MPNNTGSEGETEVATEKDFIEIVKRYILGYHRSSSYNINQGGTVSPLSREAAYMLASKLRLVIII